MSGQETTSEIEIFHGFDDHLPIIDSYHSVKAGSILLFIGVHFSPNSFKKLVLPLFSSSFVFFSKLVRKYFWNFLDQSAKIFSKTFNNFGKNIFIDYSEGKFKCVQEYSDSMLNWLLVKDKILG